MNDKELKAAIKQFGGKLSGLNTTEALQKRLKQLQAIPHAKKEKPLPEPDKWEIEASEDGFEVLPLPVAIGTGVAPLAAQTVPIAINVFPDDPVPANSLNATLGMVQPIVQQPVYSGGLSQQQVLEATERHRRQGLEVQFIENCWEFKCSKRMDSGNMSMPLKVIVERADFVALGRPLPVVNPVIVPTVAVAADV